MTRQKRDQNSIYLILNIAPTRKTLWALKENRTLHLPSITLKALNTAKARTDTANLLSFNKLTQLFSFVPLEHYISTGAESFVVFLCEVAVSFGNHSIRRYQTFLSRDLRDIVSEQHAVRLQTSNGLFTRSGNSLVAGWYFFFRKALGTRSVICVSRTLWDENPLRSRSFFSLVFIVQVHSPVLIRQRSQSWNVLSLNNHVSMYAAFFGAISVCGLTCEPRAVYLRRGGGGGAHGWIHTLLNVIHNIKELRVSVKDVLQGLKSVKALCNSHELLRILIKSTPNHLKTWNRLPSKLYLRLPPESFPNS